VIATEDDVSIAFGAALPLGQVKSVCVDIDLVDLTADAYVSLAVGCWDWNICLASVNDTFFCTFISVIARCVIHSGHSFENAGCGPPQLVQ
jgi:hypothetical protein